MYKIGDFSKLTGASIRTLRYYDEIDLFKPDEVDLFTGYRYYSEKKLQEFQIISELKNVGFTLEEIKKYWNKFSDQIMLNKKQQLLEEADNINKKVKKIDELRSYLKDGKIEFEKVRQIEKVKVKTLVRNDMIKRKIVEENYEMYIKINGQKAMDTAIAESLKKGTARYYIIYINDEFIEDFAVFDKFNNEQNYLDIDFYSQNIFNDLFMMELVSQKLSEKYSYITILIPEELETEISKAKEYGFQYIQVDAHKGYKCLKFKKNLNGNR